MRKTRVLLGDDHALVLSGTRALLEPHCEICGCFSNGRQMVDAALVLKPDLVVLDVSMPELNGFEAARQIKSALPSTRLVFLSMHTNPFYLRKAIELGASGYVLKTGLIEELLDALRQVLDGKFYASPGFGPDILEKFGNPSSHFRSDEEPLTSRQMEILQLIAEGRLSKEIAHKLGISVKTVDFHRGRIMARLGAHSIAELVRMTVEQGLIPASTNNAL